MTSKNNVDPEGDDSLGVLDDTTSSDTIAIGLHEGTAQVSVALPTGGEDDDLVDDEVIGGEVVSDLIIDTSAVADADVLARISRDAPEIVIELPAEELPAAAETAEDRPVDPETVTELGVEAEEPGIEAADAVAHADDIVDADVLPDAAGEATDGADADGAEDDGVETVADAAVENLTDADAEPVTEADAVAGETAAAPAPKPGIRPEPVLLPPVTAARGRKAVRKPAKSEKKAEQSKSGSQLDEAAPAAAEAAPAVENVTVATPEQVAKPEAAAKPEATAKPEADAKSDQPVPPAKSEPQIDEAGSEPVETAASPASVDESAPSPAQSAETDASELATLESAVAAAKAELREAMSPTRPLTQTETRPAAAETTEENRPVATDDAKPAASAASEIARADSVPPRPASVPARPAAEVTLTSKRLDDLGDAGRESADLLTADRLLDPSRITRPEPEGTWSHLLYAVSGGRINVGDSRKARERKLLSARIAAPMSGTARFVPVLSRKGGVGKTTVTALLGMALADARDDRVIAVDANPDRGTLAERVVGGHTKSVRDLVRAQHDIRGFHDISALVARDHTRLDVLASDADPRVSEAFGDADYRDVAAVAAQYYSLVLTDSGTGIVHSVMGATLDLADQIVVVSGLSVDEARLASETLTWLETNGHAQLAREAIVVLNQSTPGTPLVRLSELEAHFSTRAKHVLRIPYDPQIAGGGPIDFTSLQPETRRAAREIAATLVEGLRVKAA
ncbi:MinD/ParA family protein [Microbacterium sp. 69-10]|uniref:nucleotide-binding protein n=1 Tax=Microbacterium sp. 69-10 TaxID=1895783 RepID=UPI000ABEA091|nr:MinD/ParA family protein [Microbacterium sp. 69-10]